MKRALVTSSVRRGLILLAMAFAFPAAPSAQAPEARSNLRIPVAVLATPMPAAGPSADVPVLVEIDGAALLEGNPGSELRGEIWASATDPTGAEVAGFVQEFAFDLNQLSDTILASGLKLFAWLSLPPGEYLLAVSVNNATSYRSGHSEVPVAVPDFQQPAPQLLTPLLAEPLDRWLTFRQTQAEGAEERPYPFLLPAGEAFMPAAQVVLDPRQEVVFLVFAHQLSGGPLAFEGQVRNPAGEPVAEPKVFLLDRMTAEEGLDCLAVGLRCAGLPDGSYELAVRVTDVGAGGSEWSTRPLVVRTALDGPETVGSMAGDDAIDQVPDSQLYWGTERPEGALSPWEVDGAYREVLTLLTTGDLNAATVALAALEYRATPHLERTEAEVLRSAELAVAADLSRFSPEELLPLLVLHWLAYDRYLQEQSFFLNAHSRTMVQAVALTYARAVATPAARSLAAGALAALTDLEEVLRAALELEPGNELALLRMAVTAEKLGRYQEAPLWLRQLLEAREDHPEAQLRLALNLRRLGEDKEAFQILNHLLESQSPPWIQEIAYQELAFAEFFANRREAARRLLRQGLERLPGNQRLRLQLAYFLERDGEAAAAVGLLDELVGQEPDPDDSPRRRYSRGPVEQMEAVRRQLLDSGRGRLPQLAALLRQQEIGEEEP